MNRLFICLIVPLYLLACLPTLRSQTPSPLVCPPDVTLTIEDFFTCDVVHNYIISTPPNTFSLIQTSGLPSGSGFPIGQTLNAFTVIDSMANTATCAFTVTVIQGASPDSMLCNPLSEIYMDTTCQASLSLADALAPGSDYYCPSLYQVEVNKINNSPNGPWSPAVFNSAHLNQTYIVRVQYLPSGSFCIGNVRITDTIPPTIHCQDITVSCVFASLSPYEMADQYQIAGAVPDVSDNCTPSADLKLQFITISEPANTCDSLYQRITLRWLSQDAQFNKDVCNQRIFMTRPSIQLLLFQNDTLAFCSAPG